MPVHVELTEFCQDFTQTLRPVSRSLDDAIVALHKLDPEARLGGVLSSFVDIQHRLKILTDKAEQQHAYLLIFGPLKSGKSTLMNAISGAYVSEVSSLPAYPCLVYVHEGEPRRISITRFDGSREEFPDEEALHAQIEKAHAELAEQLRQADREGRNFNPAVDFPRAIRRIDYVLPAPNLRQSGTILVDTPGLYTKMRYNYEQLTRDFRHNAACAVFVVKTDNLFFDQVFDEFRDLLGVFSRVFLVVNIDSSKQDLAPHGDLRPALESREPLRIVQAFEDFTASAQLREAIANGQLRIYLVDLLETARRSLAGEMMLPAANPEVSAAAPETDAEENAGEPEEAVSSDEAEAGPAESTDEDEDLPDAEEGALLGAPDEPEPETAEGDTRTAFEAKGRPRTDVGFEAFLDDLTRYLNSSDYIVEFMADSLRQGDTLLGEMRDDMASSDFDRFRTHVQSLEEESSAVEEKVERVQALEDTDWFAAARETQSELDAEFSELARSELKSLHDRLEKGVNEWFESDSSLQSLVEERLEPAISETHEKLENQLREITHGRFARPNSGLKLDAQTVGHLHKLEFSLDRFFEEYAQKEAEAGNGQTALPAIDLHQQDVPVKKRWIDWLFFRRPRAIRRRLFGEEDPSNRTIAVEVKEKRLGDAARMHLFDQVERHIEQDLKNRDQEKLHAFVQAYGSHLQDSIRSHLVTTREQLQQRAETLRRQREAGHHVLATIESLSSATESTRDKTNQLHQRFVGDRDPHLTGDAEQSEDSNADSSAAAEEEENQGLTSSEDDLAPEPFTEEDATASKTDSEETPAAVEETENEEDNTIEKQASTEPAEDLMEEEPTEEEEEKKK